MTAMTSGFSRVPGQSLRMAGRSGLCFGFRGFAIAALSLCALAVSPTKLQARDADVAVKTVVATGLRGGIVFLPQATDAKAAVELAKTSPFIVRVQTGSEDLLREIKQRAASEGILGKKLYAGLGTADHLPLAPRSATVVLASGLRAADGTDASLDAWLAALAPERGVLILGGDGMKAPDLAAIGKRLAARPGVFLRKSPNESFLFAGQRAAEGTDTWTHKFHNPANTRTSLDRTLKAQFLPAWYALPTHLGYWGDTMVADHGRAYHVWANRAHINSVSLRCYDLRSGQLLWERPFAWDKPRDSNSAGYYPGRSCMAATGDGLALVDEADILFLDGESGAEHNRLAGPRPGGQIKWMACAGGLLAVLAGDPDTFSTTPLQQISMNPLGRQLAVYDLSSRELLWKETEEGDIDERQIAILDGRLYCHAQGKRVVCREMKTGKMLWENRDPKTLEVLALTPREAKELHNLLVSLRNLAATPQVLYFSMALAENTVALSAADGRLLWAEKQSNSRGRSVPDVLWGDNVIRRGAGGEGLYSLLANEKVGAAVLRGDGCGPSFMVGDKLFGAFGGVWNPNDGSIVRHTDLKSPCDVGVIVSSGVAISPASTCRCALEIHGFRAFTDDPGTFPAEKTSSEQLLRGPALGRPLAADKDVSAQWPAFRHDARRSGATAARISTTAPIERWRWRPAVANPVVDPKPSWNMRYLEIPEHLPTQAVAVDGTAYLADSQGVVRALDLKTGAERWSFAIGSKVAISPQWHRDRLLVGASSGVVYCLDAADGALAWSYRVPERQRQIMWYGHLVSTWPVLGGLACADGVAYALAGFQSGNGLFSAALDISTGKVLWKGDDQNNKLGLAGVVALDEERILFHPGGAVPAALDRKTGRLIQAPQSNFMGANQAGEPTFGRDVAVLPGREIVYGGKRIYDDFSAWANPAKLFYTLCKADFETSNAPLRNLGADLIDGSMTPPVFDRELMVLARPFAGRKQPGQIQAWPVTEMPGRVAAMPDGARRLPWMDKRLPYSFGTLIPKGAGLPEGGLWKEMPNLPAYTMALCANAVLVIHPGGGQLENVKDWSLTAMRREDGAALWSFNLPGRPAWDGLSVAADGGILIALWDGSLLCLKAKLTEDKP